MALDGCAELAETVRQMDEAQSHGKTIREYAPRSPGARMLAAIAAEIDGGCAPVKRKRTAPKVA
ncbi:hypothetical protein [Corallococcus sp. 4LFB]|uniref:hypothetical protein n=1 Tax=Corallococcus sp. 4LFB TaxID=3383249 RepID=UPI0039770645